MALAGMQLSGINQLTSATISTPIVALNGEPKATRRDTVRKAFGEAVITNSVAKGGLLRGRKVRHESSSLRSRQSRTICQASASTSTTEGELIELGKSGICVSACGVGAWAWGDRFFWGFNDGYGESDVRDAFFASVAGGLTFVDTAEVYGNGLSERLLGNFIKDGLSAGQLADQAPPSAVVDTSKVTVATKFAPQPQRYKRGDVVEALRNSLGRLRLGSVDLYMLHWPAAELFGIGPNENFLDGLADCHDKKLAKAVGVSNYGPKRLRAAHALLAGRGVPLASNQIQYSLVYRAPDRSGLIETCKELGVTPIAYSPLAQGLLTGKFTVQNRPRGARALFTKTTTLEALDTRLIPLMREIGEEHGGKTPAQVALNWVICKGALPIPGVKNIRQAQECAGAIGWRLTDQEVADLEKAAAGIEVFGAPFEGNL